MFTIGISASGIFILAKLLSCVFTAGGITEWSTSHASISSVSAHQTLHTSSTKSANLQVILLNAVNKFHNAGINKYSVYSDNSSIIRIFSEDTSTTIIRISINGKGTFFGLCHLNNPGPPVFQSLKC